MMSVYHKYGLTSVVLFTLSLLMGCASSRPPIASESHAATTTLSTIDTEVAQELDALFQKMTDKDAFSGAILIAKNDQIIISKGYGFANHEEMLPNTAQTVFNIVSLTKQFTAMAIMILHRQGKVELHTSICTYIPECPETWNRITVHHLLTHTSGINDVSNVYLWRDVTSSLPREQLIADTKKLPVPFNPGERFKYSETGYTLLGVIIESVTGQDFEAFLKQHIFEPLQMSHTSITGLSENRAVGYMSRANPAPPFNLAVSSSGGALSSNVEDLYRWDQALYTEQLLPTNLRDMMFTAHIPTGSNGWGYGYGWRTGPNNQRPFLVHGGIIDGFRTFIKRFPKDKATIIILANQDNVDTYELADEIEKILFQM